MELDYHAAFNSSSIHPSCDAREQYAEPGLTWMPPHSFHEFSCLLCRRGVMKRAFLAVCAFGLPGSLHEDGPERAVGAALAMVQSLKAPPPPPHPPPSSLPPALRLPMHSVQWASS